MSRFCPIINKKVVYLTCQDCEERECENIYINKYKVSQLRAEFPPGTKVKLIKMNDEYTIMPKGLHGIVTMVDDIGTIHVNWENGSTLGVIFGEDEIKIIK